jgi:hypothetical protein
MYYSTHVLFYLFHSATTHTHSSLDLPCLIDIQDERHEPPHLLDKGFGRLYKSATNCNERESTKTHDVLVDGVHAGSFQIARVLVAEPVDVAGEGPVSLGVGVLCA